MLKKLSVTNSTNRKLKKGEIHSFLTNLKSDLNFEIKSLKNGKLVTKSSQNTNFRTKYNIFHIIRTFTAYCRNNFRRIKFLRVNHWYFE